MTMSQKPLLLLSLLAASCQSADSRLLVAERTLTVAQNGWADLLEKGLVKNRVNIEVATAALNQANATVARAYAARRQPSTRGTDGKPVSVSIFSIDEVERAVKEAVATCRKIRAEGSR